VTYPDPAVIAAVERRFVALRLDWQDPHVRELRIAWLPTLLVLDRRGVEQWRNVNAVPPAELLDGLDLGEAHARAREGDHAAAAALLASALARRDDGPLHPELLYWLAIAEYHRDGHDGAARDRRWSELVARHPDSIWALRVPWDAATGRRPAGA